MRLFCYLVLGFYSLNAFADYNLRKPDTYQVLPPPVTDSVAEQQEYKLLRERQKNRTGLECYFAGQAAFATFEVFWETVFAEYVQEFYQINPIFTEQDILGFKDHIKGVMRYTVRVTRYFKTKYKRVRPYDKDKSLQPCTFIPGGQTSYPSSHASKVFASACVLSSMYPEHKEILMSYAEFMADLRVLGGVHHSSDIATGKDIGLQVCAEVLKH